MLTARRIQIGITVIVAVATYALLPSGVDEPARRSIAIFVAAAILWATEAIPLYATSLCVIGLQVLCLAGDGGMAELLPTRSALPDTGWPAYTAFFEPFASSIIILFMGGFLLSAAVSKHHLDQVIAARVLAPFTRRPIRLVFVVMAMTAVFSMWMSNTATTVMMLAILRPALAGLEGDRGFHRALVLAVPFGANIGGIGTPIGTPPNAVAMAALRQAGVQISFLDWMLMAVPLAALLLVAAGWLLIWCFPPPRGLELADIAPPAKPIDWRGRLTLGVLVVAIALWLTSEWHGIAAAAVALLAAAALTMLGVLAKRDVDSIDWNVLILMWGGLSLGRALELTGVLDLAVAAIPIDQLGRLGLAVSLVVLAVGLSTFMSNTATAIVLIPIVIALPTANAVELVVLIALACSFAMAMPVSTPPNAIAFATGKVPAAALVRSGLLVTVVCILVLLAGHQWILPLMLDPADIVGLMNGVPPVGGS